MERPVQEEIGRKYRVVRMPDYLVEICERAEPVPDHVTRSQAALCNNLPDESALVALADAIENTRERYELAPAGCRKLTLGDAGD
jgi:hypothetical protein